MYTAQFAAKSFVFADGRRKKTQHKKTLGGWESDTTTQAINKTSYDLLEHLYTAVYM